MSELHAGELKPLHERVEIVRRRWSSDWLKDDQGVQYIFAGGDIRTLLKALDQAEAALRQPQPMPLPVEVQPPQHVREYIETVLEGEYTSDELRFVVYNDTQAHDWLNAIPQQPAADPYQRYGELMTELRALEEQLDAGEKPFYDRLAAGLLPQQPPLNRGKLVAPVPDEQMAGPEDDRVRLTFDAAVAMLPDGEHIHTFLNSSSALLGADWDRVDILALLRRGEPELAGDTATAMGHGLVAWRGRDAVFIATRPTPPAPPTLPVGADEPYV